MTPPWCFGARVRSRRKAAFALFTVNTSVYIDGFNLYYGALKPRPDRPIVCRWLNLDLWCQTVLPSHNVGKINYYTALVSDLPHNPGQAARQQAYLRALRTLPKVEITEGHYLTHKTWMPQADPAQSTPTPIYDAFGKPLNVQVLKTEEKGSDVNLATHLLRDAFLNAYDIAVVISNDSDLLEPIKIARSLLGKKVWILNPQQRASVVLRANCDEFRPIRQGALRVSQFANTLTDSVGAFQKLTGW